MEAVPEGDVAPGVAPDVEAVRLREAVRVAVGGGEADEDGGAAGDDRAADLGVLDR